LIKNNEIWRDSKPMLKDLCSYSVLHAFYGVYYVFKEIFSVTDPWTVPTKILLKTME
jgi:hypothetical protein